MNKLSTPYDHDYEINKDFSQQKILIFFNFFSRLKQKRKNIFIKLFDIAIKNIYDNKNNKIFPSIKTFIKKTGCCSKTVKRANKDIRTYLEPFDLIKIKRLSKHGRQDKNEYIFSNEALLAILLIKYCSGFYNESYLQLLIKQFSENQELVMKKLTRRIKKCPRANLKSVPAIYNIIYITYNKDIKVLPKQVPQKNELVTFSWNGIKLNTQQKKYFLYNYPITILEDSIKDYQFFTHKGNQVSNNFALLYNRAKYHNRKRFERRFKTYGI